MSQRQQFELTDFNDNSRLIVWLDVDSRLTRGIRLTLKDIPRRDWVVTRVYKTIVDSNDADFRRGWKVGGLR